MELTDFKRATTVLELYRIANDLKKNGFNEAEVNREMSKYRMELANKRQSVSTLKKVTVNVSTATPEVTMTVPISVKDGNTSSNIVRINERNVIEL